jgi:hypothetical protein
VSYSQEEIDELYRCWGKKIEEAQAEADHHAKKRREMAKCVAICIKKAIEAKGNELADATKGEACGTLQASFMNYTHDILVALGELEHGEDLK